MLIIIDKEIITNVPAITGKTIYSNDTSANKAINGLAAAGGWIDFKYIINVTVVPTDKPNEINDIPKPVTNTETPDCCQLASEASKLCCISDEDRPNANCEFSNNFRRRLNDSLK